LLVNLKAFVNPKFPLNAGIFRVAEDVLVSQGLLLHCVMHSEI